MMQPSKNNEPELAVRMARWIFIGFGVLLSVCAAALLASSVVAGWWLAGAALLVLAFGTFAPPRIQASILAALAPLW
jgi:hypothetical protein